MTETPNTLFPGRPDYAGPTEGWFGLLHHAQLYERSRNVMERVNYVRRFKPNNEVAVRLHNMIYLGGCEAAAKIAPLYADYEAKCASLTEDYWAKRASLTEDYRAKLDALYADYKAKLDALYADYEAKRAPLDADILAYIRSHIPDCAWNGAELEFPK